MKTNPAVRFRLRMRGRVLCLALVGMVGMAFLLGGFLAERVAHHPTRPYEGPPMPNGSIGHLVVAAR